MKNFRIAAAGFVFGVLACALPAVAQQGDTATVQTVVTVVPKKGEAPALRQQNLKVKANGKDSTVTSWQPLQGDRAGLEFVILIDDSARSSLSLQLADLAKFVQGLPPSTQVGIAYMQNGRAVFTENLTPDHALAAKAIRITNGTPGSNASPYFCLSDLAKHWPSQDRNNRREVLMVTDGVDRYNLRYDPDNPYLQSAISDAQRAGIIVYSIYYRDMGRLDRSGYETDAGQNLLIQLTQATGGKLYWQGLGNPVSFRPFLEDLSKRFENQYELGFTAPAKSRPELVGLKVKSDSSHVTIDAPERVPVGAMQ
jgi:VWFA-related protein